MTRNKNIKIIETENTLIVQVSSTGGNVGIAAKLIGQLMKSKKEIISLNTCNNVN